MKKNLFYLLGLGLLTTTNVSAQLTITDLNNESQHADITVMDWDKDGDLDLLISGQTPGAINMKAYLNDGAGNYTATTVPFVPVTRSAFDWNDINMDGNPDFLESGFGGSGAYTRIFRSDALGAFTEDPLVLPQMATGSGFADFNNDGYIDIYIMGNDDQGKSKILFNDKSGNFVDQHTFDTYSFKFDPDVSVVDYDNDKDMDIYVSVSELVTPAGARFSRLFQNNNGVFTEVLSFMPEKGYGSSAWGDYDGDGFLDLLCNGVGTPGDDFKYRIFKNNGGTSFSLIQSYDYGQFSTGDGGRFFDWDNDGDLDFVVTGWTGSRQATALYINNGGVFTEFAFNALLPGFSESSIEVADVDNDSDLDLFISGYSNNDFDGDGTVGPYGRNLSILIKNPNTAVNLPPTAPTNLNVSGNQASLTLSWNAATDEPVPGIVAAGTPQASLSYNIFIVDAAGKWFYYPLADTSTGKLRLQKMGNVNLNMGWIIKGLPAGTYRWGVQAIDNSFMGSEFAKSSFTIDETGALPVILSSYTVKADGSKSKIEWTTASEQNNGTFVVERSSNGTDFYPVATIEGKGTTNETNRYFVYDNNPAAGTNYYRVIQYNIDGKPTNFGIKIVAFNKDAIALAIAYPNPAKDVLGIRLSNFKGKLLTVTMIDMLGKQIHRELIQTGNGQGYYPLHFKSKPKTGQYLLNINGTGLKQTLKVIVK